MAFGSKNSTPSFVLTLPLDISLNEQDYLYKEFKKCGVIYNQLVSVTTKMWHQLRKTRKYRDLMTAIAKAVPDSEEQKALLKQRQKKIQETGFSEGAFHKLLVSGLRPSGSIMHSLFWKAILPSNAIATAS